MGAILCDLSKAFDCISHKIVIQKLEYYGIYQQSVQLLSGYLSGRTQHTFSGGKLSGALNVKHGVYFVASFVSDLRQ